ncbi:MAG: DUF5665 domain-containing protein [Candidatus Levybacteria bacterium]|nr:DUF5665 domain-containing protein [Candidatus Levybacteria bacterium]
MQSHEAIHKNRKEIIINNFIGGIAWGLGATIGLSIVVGIFGIIFSNINLIPIVGNFVSQITSFVLQNNPNLIK